MKAIICTQYGPPEVLQQQEVPKPKPKARQVLVRVRAATVAAGDVRIRTANPTMIRFIFGFRRPRRAPILGLELAGEVEAVGAKVTRFQPGDTVYGLTGFRLGAYAEYRCLSEKGSIALKPNKLSFEEAAAVPVGALTALTYLQHKARLQGGENVLIYGASGSVGTYAVQLAKYFGSEVTAVCSEANHELVRSIGADHCIDYHTEDFTANGQLYDLIFDAVGKITQRQSRGSLAPLGRFLTVDKGLARGGADNLNFLTSLIEAGHLQPVIDRDYPIDDIISAHRYVETGRKRGNVVITI